MHHWHVRCTEPLIYRVSISDSNLSMRDPQVRLRPLDVDLGGMSVLKANSVKCDSCGLLCHNLDDFIEHRNTECRNGKINIFFHHCATMLRQRTSELEGIEGATVSCDLADPDRRGGRLQMHAACRAKQTGRWLGQQSGRRAGRQASRQSGS